MFLLLLGSGVASAEPPPTEDFNRDGYYVGVQGVYALEDFDMIGTRFDDEFGVNGHVGYRFLRNFALEAEFEWIDGFSGTTGTALAGLTGKVDTYAINLNTKLYPLARAFEQDSVLARFQPFAQVGVGWQWAQRKGFGLPKNNTGDIVGRFGGGLEVYLTENFALTGNAVYALSGGKVDDFRYLSFGWGVQWRFSPLEE
jgi:opacity protein-like surface antigen